MKAFKLFLALIFAAVLFTAPMFAGATAATVVAAYDYDAIELLPSLVYASTTTGPTFSTVGYMGKFVLILSSAASGNGSYNSTYAVNGCATVGGTYAPISGAAFTVVANAVSVQVLILDADALPNFIEIIDTVAGGSVTGSSCIIAYARKQAR